MGENVFKTEMINVMDRFPRRERDLEIQGRAAEGEGQAEKI